MPTVKLTLNQIREKGWDVLTKEEKGGLFRSATGKPIVIGPLVADANFSAISRPKINTTIKFAAGAESLPETWSWRPDQIDSRYDTENRLNAKKNISPVLNQASCGSCWAFALASCISDCFVVSGKYLQLPDSAGSIPTSPISPTSIMACIRDRYTLGCLGGNPGYAAEIVQSNGVLSSTCLDYSFILDNKYFNGESRDHFDSAQKMGEAMNAALPNCGCIDPLDSRKKFTITDVHTLPANSEDSTSAASLKNTWDLVRRWIWENGSVVACYTIYENFTNERNGFQATNGVYFEDHPYSGGGKQIAGLHAVRVLGWGVEKNCPLPDGGTADVPYWMVANSWSEDWADKGYFKMARYPYNKVSQFDTLVTTEDGFEFGGFILFKAGEIVDGVIPKVNSEFENSVNANRKNAGFYNSELLVTSVPPVVSESDKKKSSNGESIIIKILGGDINSTSGRRFGKRAIILFVILLLLISVILFKPSFSTKSSTYGGNNSSSGAFKGLGMHQRFKF